MSSCVQNPEKINILNQVISCRGCTKDCKYISKCDGKLWRMSDAILLAILEESKINSQ